MDTTAKTTVGSDGEVEDLGVFVVLLGFGLCEEYCSLSGFLEVVCRQGIPLLAAPYFLASRIARSALVNFVEATTFID